MSTTSFPLLTVFFFLVEHFVPDELGGCPVGALPDETGFCCEWVRKSGWVTGIFIVRILTIVYIIAVVTYPSLLPPPLLTMFLSFSISLPTND